MNITGDTFNTNKKACLIKPKLQSQFSLVFLECKISSAAYLENFFPTPSRTSSHLSQILSSFLLCECSA